MPERKMEHVARVARLSQKMFRYHLLSRLTPLSPRTVIICVTMRCNARCIMCNIWRKRADSELTLEEWGKIMEDPIFESIENLEITGGEPFISPNLVTLVELYIQRMPQLANLSVVSNGIAGDVVVAKTKELAMRCRERGVRFTVSISLDGIGELHELIRGTEACFDKTTKVLLELKRIESIFNFRVFAGSMVLRDNLSRTEEMRKWFRGHGIPFTFQIVGFNDSYVRNRDLKERVDFGAEQLPDLHRFLTSEASKKGWHRLSAYYWRDLLAMYRDNNRRTTPCPALKDQFAIDSYGDVFYCLHEKLERLSPSKSVSAIYYSPENLKRRGEMWRRKCGCCTSACVVDEAIKCEPWIYLWFRLTGQPWYGIRTGLLSQIKKALRLPSLFAG